MIVSQVGSADASGPSDGSPDGSGAGVLGVGAADSLT
jgi:hypothetical protein